MAMSWKVSFEERIKADTGTYYKTGSTISDEME